jgi:hypothetical protein
MRAAVICALRVVISSPPSRSPVRAGPCVPADLADVQQFVAEPMQQALAVAGVVLRLGRAASRSSPRIADRRHREWRRHPHHHRRQNSSSPKFWGPPPCVGVRGGRQRFEAIAAHRIRSGWRSRYRYRSLISTPSKGKDTRTRARRAPLGAVLIRATRAGTVAGSPHLSASFRPS